MRKSVIILVSLIFLLALAVGSASAFSLSLYETVDNTPGGEPSEVGPIVDIPDGVHVVPGFIYLLEGPDFIPDRSGLSDVLWFRDEGGFASTVQLWSDPIFPEEAFDASGNFYGVPSFTVEEDQWGPTIIYPGTSHEYIVYSDPWGPEVPVPPSLVLLGSGLLGLVSWRSFKRA